MILATTIQSERGKTITKTANDFIFIELTVKKQKVGEIELYYFNDSVDDKCLLNDIGECQLNHSCREVCTTGEWLVKFRRAYNNQKEEDKPDWDIISQGNI